MWRRTLGFAACAALAAVMMTISWEANAEATNQGPKVCSECHRAEHEIWSETAHAKSYKTVHKSDKAKGILKALGEKSMKRSEVCTICHYTMVSKKPGAAGKPKAGPSCESCHGASSDWFAIHNEYGGKGVKREDEDAGHKSERIASAAAAGMRWPSDKYGVAENCMACHGLANPAVPGEALATMLENGHPTVPDWELVRYSQGQVRHRFYPPDMTTNAALSGAEAAEMYVIGQAAKLVSATTAAGNSDSAKYKEFQAARAASARDALSGVAAAADLLANPSADAARALVAAIKGQDLTGEVGGMLPGADSYK